MKRVKEEAAAVVVVVDSDEEEELRPVTRATKHPKVEILPTDVQRLITTALLGPQASLRQVKLEPKVEPKPEPKEDNREGRHPCLFQNGWCPFLDCRWKEEDAGTCVQWLRGKCTRGSTCCYRHGEGDSGKVVKALDPRQVFWYPRRAEAEEAETPFTDFMVAADVGTRGGKKFAALPRPLLPNLVLQTPLEDRNFYAVTPPGVPVHFYLDVDHGLRGDETANDISDTRDRLLKAALQPCAPDFESFAVVDATTDRKISFHVHARLKKGGCFPSSAALKEYVRDRLPPGLPDLSVYSQFGCFRLPYCTKRGRQAPLLPLPLSSECDDPAFQSLPATDFSSGGPSEASLISYCVPSSSSSPVSGSPESRPLPPVVKEPVKEPSAPAYTWTCVTERPTALPCAPDPSEWLGREWCRFPSGAAGEKSTVRPLLLSRRRDGNPGGLEHLCVPTAAVPSIVLADEKGTYSVAVPRDAVPADFHAELSRCDPEAVPALLRHCDALDLPLAQVVVLRGPASRCRVHARFAGAAAFDGAQALRAFAHSVFGDLLESADRLVLPWSGGWTVQHVWGHSTVKRLGVEDGPVGVEDVFSLCMAARPDAVAEVLVGGDGSRREVVGATPFPALGPPAAPSAFPEALLGTLHALHPRFATLTPSSFTWHLTGQDRRCFSLRVHATRFCLNLNRTHRATHPNFLFRPAAIYLRCFSNDCHETTRRIEWPQAALDMRNVLFADA